MKSMNGGLYLVASCILMLVLIGANVMPILMLFIFAQPFASVKVTQEKLTIENYFSSMFLTIFLCASMFAMYYIVLAPLFFKHS